MNTSPVSPHIERLVDHLRSDASGEITIGDIAGVTEVLLSTMQRYFNSLDLSIYDEFRNLTDHIKQAREEIAQLRPNDIKEEKIPRAGAELEAIVQATEEATGTIMDAAEEIMSADTEDPDAYQQAVNDACMRIFEACSFQDITGQRITKVVSTLTFIEERLGSLQVAWGPGISDSEKNPSEQEEYERRVLLNGPALAGEGIEQDDIDRLLSSGDNQPASADDGPTDDDIDAVLNGSDVDDIDAILNGAASGDAEADENPADEAPEIAEIAEVPVKAKAKEAAEPAPAKAKKKPAAKPEVPAEQVASVSGDSSQADIDALFD